MKTQKYKIKVGSPEMQQEDLREFLRKLNSNPELVLRKKIHSKTKKMVKDALQSPFGLSIVNTIKREIKKII